MFTMKVSSTLPFVFNLGPANRYVGAIVQNNDSTNDVNVTLVAGGPSTPLKPGVTAYYVFAAGGQITSTSATPVTVYISWLTPFSA